MKYDHENLELCPECRLWTDGECKQHSIPKLSAIELEVRICHEMLSQAGVPVGYGIADTYSLSERIACLINRLEYSEGGG